MHLRRPFLGLLAVLSLVAPAAAQTNPTFQFEKPPEKPADWKVQAKGGLLVTSGNSQSRNVNMGITGSRQTDGNKLSLDANLIYGRSNVLQPVLDMNGAIVDLQREPQTTANAWKARGRYDRFFTPNNAAYVLGQIGADKVAGKKLVGGGQVGYSRQLLKTDMHTAVAELGYDFSYESYVSPPDRPVDPVAIHSARVFVGELLKLTNDTGLNAGVEALFNLNEEKVPNASDPASNKVAAFKDTRVTGKLALTTTLYKNLSFGFGFTLLYDQNPAPRPIPSSAKGAKYADTFHPFADRVDTLTEATLVFTFL